MKRIILAAVAAVVQAAANAAMEEVASMPAAARLGYRTFTETTPREVGSYDVTFTFGDAEKPTVNWVKFEGRRVALAKVETQPGETKRATFTARVKGPIAKEDAPTNEAPFPYALNLTVVTSADRVAEPEVARNDAARVIYLCGDSTVTDQQREPWGSWGQCLPAFFGKGTAVANFARSGLTTKSFLNQKRLERILAHLKADDVVVVQFGHNDQKDATLTADGGYRDKLNFYIDKVREKGAKIVLVSPMERLRFDRKGWQEPKTLAGYAQAVKEVAEARGVPFIDLNDASYAMYGAMGAKRAPKLFCTFTVDEQVRDFFGEGADRTKIRRLQDKTHHSIYGAYVLAHYLADRLAEVVPELAASRREGTAAVDVAAPEADPAIPPTGVVDTTRPEGDVGNKE